MDAPIIFERNGHLYIVGSVAPITPDQATMDEFAFADALRKQAPNENLLWLRGQYVEADKPNRNGQLWTSDELSIKSLSPTLMPITVMHDPRTAVGLIADTKLLVPENDNVPRARIETALAVWAHRFPAVAEECLANYKQGTLMQSMECSISHYSCTDCGRGFVKLPQDAERANWCDHLRKGSAENGIPVRRLEGVTFTGTGLIFGTRNGATGANDKAHLDMLQAEVAEFHERTHTDRRIPRRTSRMDEITIKRSEYDELKAALTKVTELAQRVIVLEADLATANESAKKVEKLEIDLKAAEKTRDDEKAAREKLEETARAATLSGDRIAKLGTAFTAKLPETVQTRLQEQAKTLSDEDWAARLDELAELTGVKPDEAAASPEGGTTVTTTETARTKLGGSAPTGEPSRTAVSTVLGGVLKAVRPPTPEPAGK